MTPYFVFLFSMILLSSMFNCGWYEITRGYIEILPDGTERKYGKIFMGWYFFWFREKDKKWIHYTGKQLRELCDKMKAHPTCGPFNLTINRAETVMYAERSFIQKMPYLKDVFDCQFLTQSTAELREGKEVVVIIPFKSYIVYTFPWILREPLAGCITCFASIYSSIIFWGVHLFAYKSYLQQNVYGWADNGVMTLIFTWIAYSISCAFLGTYLYRKMP